MGKCFRSADVNQALLLPPSLHDWLPEKHLARFLVDVVDALELAAIYDSYDEKDGRGQAAYDPAMMVRVLLYGYCTGSYSSRQLQAKTYEDIAFRYLAADEHPDHSTLAEFRQRHLEALAGLFTQALQLCQKAGLVKLGQVAIDGSKIQGNASKHKAMREASWSESETMKPSDNILRKEYAQLTRLQRAVNADVASLHANPVAETVDNVRKQQGLTETSPMRQHSPAGYQRRHGEKEDVSTGEALGARRRNLVEEATAITASGKCRSRHQGDGSGRTTVDGRAAKRVWREGPGPVNMPFDKVRQG